MTQAHSQFLLLFFILSVGVSLEAYLLCHLLVRTLAATYTQAVQPMCFILLKLYFDAVLLPFPFHQ